MKTGLKQLSAICALMMAGIAQAGVIIDTPILGGSLLVASDGHVFAEFMGSKAGYFNTLYLDTRRESPSGRGDGAIFDENSPVNGTLLDLGAFRAGTELIFRLDVRETSLSFFSGDPARNPDGLAHARAITSLPGAFYITTVGFEDLLGGGDYDFNDFTFSLTNVIDPPANLPPRQQQPPSGSPVPEPSILVLMTTGLFGLCLGRCRRRASW